MAAPELFPNNGGRDEDRWKFVVLRAAGPYPALDGVAVTDSSAWRPGRDCDPSRPASFREIIRKFKSPTNQPSS